MTIAGLTCAELTALYRRGEVSPVEAARDCLARIAANARFNAFMPIDPEPVLEAAAVSEARWRQGRPLGPVDGVPATIKDNIWLKGYPTRRGSKTGDAAPAAADAPAVARLREQGAILLGKTCMPEHGWIGVCHSPLTGITRNPWNPSTRPAARPAAGRWRRCWGSGCCISAPTARGHLRIPAAFTGVFGMKPSYGQVPTLSAVAAQCARASGADHAQCRRCRADAVGHRAARRARHDGVEFAGARFRRRIGAGREGSAHRAVDAARASRQTRSRHRSGAGQSGARAGRAGRHCRRSRSAARARCAT